MTMHLLLEFFLTSKEESVINRGAHIRILSQLWWGKLHVLLDIYEPLVWDGVF
jgi:hypothetical protein